MITITKRGEFEDPKMKGTCEWCKTEIECAQSDATSIAGGPLMVRCPHCKQVLIKLEFTQ